MAFSPYRKVFDNRARSPYLRVWSRESEYGKPATRSAALEEALNAAERDAQALVAGLTPEVRRLAPRRRLLERRGMPRSSGRPPTRSISRDAARG